MGELLHLSHNVGIVEMSSDKFENDQVVLNTLEKIRYLDQYMLSALVKDWVIGEIDSGLVVS